MRNVIAVVLGGGRGTRLYPLTKFRSKPAVPFGGKYRLIDIPLSNCINSELNRVFVVTQFLSVSLHRHIRESYRFDTFRGGFVEILAAQQTMDQGTDWYEGTADAVRKNLRYFQQSGVEHVLILSGDQLYRMDFRQMYETHQRTGADVTIAAKPVSQEQASSLGIMRVDNSGRVVGFLEKPQSDRDLNLVRMDHQSLERHGILNQNRPFIASMGIYLFKCQTLLDVLTKTDYQDFGKEVFPASIRSRYVHFHSFDGYWEDIGTVRAYYEANLSLARAEPPFDLAMAESPVYTRARYLPPTRFSGASISGSLIADGCFVGKGTTIENSIIGLRSVIGDNVTIRDSVLLGADEYDSGTVKPGAHASSRPLLGIGDGSVVEGAIIDKNCRIGRNCMVSSVDRHSATEWCTLVDGIPVVVKNSIVPDGQRF